MDIRNIGNTSLGNLKPVNPAELNRSEEAKDMMPPETEGPKRMPPERDRFDVSNLGPARDVRSPELQFAQQALRSMPEADAERLAEIKARISEGHYTRPEVLNGVADRIADLFKP